VRHPPPSLVPSVILEFWRHGAGGLSRMAVRYLGQIVELDHKTTYAMMPVWRAAGVRVHQRLSILVDVGFRSVGYRSAAPTVAFKGMNSPTAPKLVEISPSSSNIEDLESSRRPLWYTKSAVAWSGRRRAAATRGLRFSALQIEAPTAGLTASLYWVTTPHACCARYKAPVEVTRYARWPDSRLTRRPARGGRGGAGLLGLGTSSYQCTGSQVRLRQPGLSLAESQASNTPNVTPRRRVV